MSQYSRHANIVLDTIVSSLEERGYPPSVNEIRAAIGHQSKATTHDLLQRLVAQGLIEVDTGVARGIRVTATGMKALTETL